MKEGADMKGRFYSFLPAIIAIAMLILFSWGVTWVEDKLTRMDFMRNSSVIKEIVREMVKPEALK